MKATLHCGDAREVLATLPAESVQCVVTSPPYLGLRDYQCAGQIGLESRPDCAGWATGERCGECYVCVIVEVFREVKRVLRSDGVCWLNLGDSFAANRSYQVSDTKHLAHSFGRANVATVPDGLKPKDLMLIPHRVALALQADGWYVRMDNVWDKPNPMPESVTDRPTRSHEYVFQLSKSERYYYDAVAVREALAQSTLADKRKFFSNRPGWSGNPNANGEKGHPLPCDPAGRNRRSVWRITPQPYPEAHFAVFPEELAEICIKAGSREGDTVLDPFSGAGTTGVVAGKLFRDYVGIELNSAYVEMSERRILQEVGPLLVTVEVVGAPQEATA